MATDSKKDIALRYLETDRLLHADMIFSLQMGCTDILCAAADGVLLRDDKSGVHMLSAAGYKQGVAILESLDVAEVFLLHQQFMVDYLLQKYGFTTARECTQVVYARPETLPLRGSLEIKQLDASFLPQVLKHYHTVDDPAYVEEILRNGGLYGGFAAGQLCGFVGCHLEGSIGLLEIFPAYRRLGYGRELESFMINQVLEKGLIPYGHVLEGNEKSLSLQVQLGLEVCMQKLYWVF